MTGWSYDKEVDAAYIPLRDRKNDRGKTVCLTGVDVMLDIDSEGNVVGIELLGSTHRRTVLRDLGRWLKEEANGQGVH